MWTKRWIIPFTKDKAVGQDIKAFQSGLECILRGDLIGYAFEAFNHRWLDLAQYVTQHNENSLLARHLKGYKINTEQLRLIIGRLTTMRAPTRSLAIPSSDCNPIDYRPCERPAQKER